MAKKSKIPPAVVRLNALDWSHYFESNKLRMDTIDGMARTLQQDIRDLRNDHAEETRHLNVRIDSVQKDITDRLDNQTKTLAEHFDKGIDRVTEAHVQNSKRISALEKWRWLVLGGGGVVLFLIEIGSKLFSGPIGHFFSRIFGLE